MNKITISDVAKHAKVSKSTISQYLNKRYDYMSTETRRRIESAIEDLDYRPNSIARSLKSKMTFTIGVIVANILHNFSTNIIRAIEDLCREKNFHVIICNADDDPSKEREYIEMLLDKQIDGLIVFPTGENLKLYEQMKHANFPLVFVDRIVEGFSTDTIILDNIKASQVAVQYLIDNQYKRIAFITTSLVNNINSRYERVNGYKQTLKENNIKIIDNYIIGANVNDMQEELEKLFQLDNRPQAILAGNDLSLIETLKYIQTKKLEIPKDIAVISFDDIPYSAIYNPSLTTISQPTEEMGRAAGEVLIEKILNKNKSEKNSEIYRFEANFIKRNSC